MEIKRLWERKNKDRKVIKRKLISIRENFSKQKPHKENKDTKKRGNYKPLPTKSTYEAIY
jgi:hypothetical protein